LHSPAYKNYIQEKEDFQRAKVEGKLKKDDNGREYFEKKFPTWTKKVYFEDIVNPYDGPDRPEMLRKSAGKSFFRQFVRTRNAFAMSEELSDIDDGEPTRMKTCDNVLNRATGQFSGSREPEIKDADIVVEPEKEDGKESGIEDL